MRIIEKKSAERYEPYGTTAPSIHGFRAIDPDHVPYNKRPHEVEKSRAELDFQMHEAAQWLAVRMTETTTSHRGNTSTRVIAFTLNVEQADDLAEFIRTRGKQS